VRSKVGGELQDAKKVLKDLDVMILAVKGKGRYNDRKMFRLSDLEFDQLFSKCVTDFQRVFVNIAVAEAMLREPAPSLHARWDEYQRRRTECMAELGKK